MHLIDLFDKVAKVNRPEAKLSYLRQYPFQQDLKDVLRRALDPFITYGITDLGPYDGQEGRDPREVLQDLASRRLTGNAAKMELARAVGDEDDRDRELFRRIIRKDLRCGVGTKLANQFYPDLIVEFEVMRADKYKAPVKGKSYFVEPKMDGLRGVAVCKDGGVSILSRNGIEFTSCDHLKPQILQLLNGQDGVLDGELVNGNFNQSSGSIRRKSEGNEGITFNIFDYLTMDEWKSCSRAYVHRRRDLEGLFDGFEYPGLVLVPSIRVEREDQIFEHYHRMLSLGLEGVIIKRADGLYKKKRSREWMKLKDVNTLDLRVKKLVQGEGKYYGMMGAAIVEYKGKNVNVGTGWSDHERELYWKTPSLLVGKILEVSFHEITPDGSLRHPRAKTIRNDKDEVDA